MRILAEIVSSLIVFAGTNPDMSLIAELYRTSEESLRVRTISEPDVLIFSPSNMMAVSSGNAQA